jgi:hypothetical protein
VAIGRAGRLTRVSARGTVPTIASNRSLHPLRLRVILRPRERTVAVVFVVGRCWYHHANESFDHRDRHDRVGRHPAPR